MSCKLILINFKKVRPLGQYPFFTPKFIFYLKIKLKYFYLNKLKVYSNQTNYSIMSSFASIYIPRMCFSWTEEEIREDMACRNIGNVSYVDFTPINKKPGFGEDVDKVVKSAFIHFHFIFIENLNQEFWNKIESGQPYKLQVTTREYWICLKNKNPIQRSLMNIHQVVENGRYLENLITEQGKELKNLKETVEEQKKIIDGLHMTVYQLLGGLYCQRTQGGILNEHLKTIGFGSGGYNVKDDTHPERIWPTTRQGDKNAERIARLEHLISHHIKPEVLMADCHCPDEEMDDDMSEQDSELYYKKHCADCGNELTEADLDFMEQYEDAELQDYLEDKMRERQEKEEMHDEDMRDAEYQAYLEDNRRERQEQEWRDLA